MMANKLINARFDSVCSRCGSKIVKGETCEYIPGDKGKTKARVLCNKCTGKEPSSKPSTPDVVINNKEVEHKVTLDIAAELAKLHAAVDKETPKIYTDTVNACKMIQDENKKAYQKMLQEEFGSIPHTIIEVKKEGKVKKIKEITHPKLADILTMVGADIPVFLMGAAGTGKNHMCKQVADALSLEFYFTNAVSNEYKITGFIDANGKYHSTQFYEAFTKGGLFFFDEIDASVPEVLVLLNAAIENRYFNFPTGKVDAHKDFRVIAAGNTYGSGASVQYVGRYQLDAASLDRFALVEIDYDSKVEHILARNDDDLVEFIHIVRKVVKDNGLRVVVSYRAIRQLSELIHVQKMDAKRAIEYSMIKGLSVDDMNIILRGLRRDMNKYLSLYKEILSERGAD